MRLNDNGLTRMSVILYILTLLTQFAVCKADCNYYQTLEAGQTYYVYNPEYPNNYTGENTCVWQAVSQDPIKLNCTVDIPANTNCNKAHLSIKFNESKEEKYCGSGTLVSEGNNVTIRFRSSKSSPGGRFLCALELETSRNCNCGWRKVPRIVGGMKTGVNEYPMMAGLIDSTQRELYCGATIISSQFVITAAHCVENKDISTIGVVVGEHDVTTGSDTNATKIFRISNCIMHPRYEADHNDVAVCKIIGDIQFSAEVGPVCLPFQHRRDNFYDVTVTVLGWGLLEFGGAKSSVLQETNLKVIPMKKCRDYYPNADKTHLCAFASGKGACQMDSGGPILWHNPVTSRSVLVGIISGGIGCASDAPELGVRTGHYVDWITSVTPGVQYCKIE
ncbi:venom serine protease 34-like [Bradysia coprophila]|uniref:venom serine protease 34-like n=1 Tax=Bradysia coprophila TaxID=38358 RepID=UPI00187DCACD|nr:venom serine protease 34-like [Bradysia coprophila]